MKFILKNMSQLWQNRLLLVIQLSDFNVVYKYDKNN